MDNRHPRPRPYGRHAAPQHPPPVQPYFRAPSISPQQQRPHHQILPTWSELLERAKLAVAKARKDILSAGESVSVWKVSQAALLMLKAGPATALALQMQQLPSLQALMAVETKINAFIHCFVAARGMTSLYDLESAICKNEGLERFEELEMGPFLQHPLVKHYFSLDGDVSEVLKISSEEIISYLGDYLYKMKGKRVVIEEFLDFLAKKKSVATKEKLGVRIRSLGLHIAFIREARRSEHASLRKSKEWKLQLGEDGGRIEVPQTDYLPTAEEDILGGNLFGSSSDDEDGDKDSSNEVRRDDKDENFTNTLGNVRISQPDGTSLTLEVKESAESHSCADWLRRDIKDRDAVLSNNANYTKKGKRKKGAKLVMEASALRIFIKTWKEACQKHSPVELSPKTPNIEDLMPYRGTFEPPTFSASVTGGLATSPVSVPKRPPTVPLAKDEIDAIIDDETVAAAQGGFRRFLVRWKDHPPSDDSWIHEDELRTLAPGLLDSYLSDNSPESSSFKSGRYDGDRYGKYYSRKKRNKGT